MTLKMPITAEQREAFFKNLNNALGASLKGRKAEPLKNDELAFVCNYFKELKIIFLEE